mgnify:CR=1 FL=1
MQLLRLALGAAGPRLRAFALTLGRMAFGLRAWIVFALAAPLTWLATFGLTTLLLISLRNALWLVVPFLLAIVLYYILFPAVRYLSRAGMVKATGLLDIDSMLKDTEDKLKKKFASKPEVEAGRLDLPVFDRRGRGDDLTGDQPLDVLIREDAGMGRCSLHRSSASPPQLLPQAA